MYTLRAADPALAVFGVKKNAVGAQMERKRAEEEARRRAEDLKRDAEREEARRRAEADTQLKVRYYEVTCMQCCSPASSHAAPQLPVAFAPMLFKGMRQKCIYTCVHRMEAAHGLCAPQAA